MAEGIVERLVSIPRHENVEITGALATAKELEQRAHSFYKENATKASGMEMKKAFSFLAMEEEKHLKIISEVERVIKAQGKFAVLSDGVLKHLEKPDIYPKGAEAGELQKKNELTVLLWAMRAEKKVEAFYRERAKKTGVKEAKEFFHALAEFESEHFRFLDGIFSILTSTDDFILG